MKRISFCIWILSILPFLSYSAPTQCSHNSLQHCTQKDINNAWIQVPWTTGGFYYHNTLTKEDKDYIPKKDKYNL